MYILFTGKARREGPSLDSQGLVSLCIPTQRATATVILKVTASWLFGVGFEAYGIMNFVHPEVYFRSHSPQSVRDNIYSVRFA